MSAQRPHADWVAAVTELLGERPELDGIGISYAVTAVVSS